MGIIYKRLGEANAAQSSQAFGVPMFIVVFEQEGVTHLERKLDGYRGKLEEFWQAQHQLVRTLNHQMRSPLMVMSLSINLLRDYAERMSSAERAEEIRQLQESLAACQKIIEQAVEQTKIADTDKSVMSSTLPLPVSSAKGNR